MPFNNSSFGFNYIPCSMTNKPCSYVPRHKNYYGLKLYMNNNNYSLLGSAKGLVGMSALASRAYNRRKL